MSKNIFEETFSRVARCCSHIFWTDSYLMQMVPFWFLDLDPWYKYFHLWKVFVFWRLGASIIVPLSFEFLFSENLFKKQYHWCWVTIDYKKSVSLLFAVQQKKLIQGTEFIFLWESENQIKYQIHQQSIQSASYFDSKTLQRVNFWFKKTCQFANQVFWKRVWFRTGYLANIQNLKLFQSIQDEKKITQSKNQDSAHISLWKRRTLILKRLLRKALYCF